MNKDKTHKKLTESKSKKVNVTIKTKGGEIIKGKPTYTECDEKGNRWIIENNGEEPQDVYEHEIEDIN